MPSALQHIITALFPITCAGCGKDLPADDRYRLCPDCFAGLPLIDGLVCVTCGKPLPDGGEHCFACRRERQYHFDSVRSAGEYDGVLRELLQGFKFRNKDYLDRILGRLLVFAVEKYGLSGSVDYIVPVPMHPLKRFLRGYNQAELLAVRLSEYLQKPVLKALRRNRFTKRQYRLSRDERRENVKDAFEVVDKGTIRNKKILVVDDICTTCATLEQCARALKKAGAESVKGLTVARD